MDHDRSPMPGMMSQDEMAKLQGLRGTSFDLAFVQGMRTHQEGAIQMANDELSQGSLPEVKTLARQVMTPSSARSASAPVGHELAQDDQALSLNPARRSAPIPGLGAPPKTVKTTFRISHPAL